MNSNEPITLVSFDQLGTFNTVASEENTANMDHKT